MQYEIIHIKQERGIYLTTIKCVTSEMYMASFVMSPILLGPEKLKTMYKHAVETRCFLEIAKVSLLDGTIKS